jgi:hypothetical protein
VVSGLWLFLLAMSSNASEPGWLLGVHFENDLFAKTDGQYTNGIKLTAVSPDLTSKFENRSELPRFAQKVMNKVLPFVPFIDEPQAARTFAFSLGQNMYTPDDIEPTALIRDDRPYAGWLYGALTFQTRTRRRQDTFDLQLGIVGPASFGEQTQDFVHRLRGIDRPQGWAHQIRNEPGIVLAYERASRTRDLFGGGRGIEADLVTRYGVTLGNVATYLGAGVQLRLGTSLPDEYGYAPIRPGNVTQIGDLPISGTPNLTASGSIARARKQLSLHAFIGVDARAVARDIFLDGNTYRDSHSVEREPLIADVFFGLSLRYRDFSVVLARVVRSREFQGQDKKHQFGSISLGFAF